MLNIVCDHLIKTISTFLVDLDLLLQFGQLSRIHLALLTLELQGLHPLLKTSGLLVQHLHVHMYM